MTILVERLRANGMPKDSYIFDLCTEAADALEAAEAQIKALREDEERLERILTVDVKLDPSTLICAGCKIRTVVTGLAQDYQSKPAARKK